jgi:hypothetical protein
LLSRADPFYDFVEDQLMNQLFSSVAPNRQQAESSPSPEIQGMFERREALQLCGEMDDLFPPVAAHFVEQEDELAYARWADDGGNNLD